MQLTQQDTHFKQGSARAAGLLPVVYCQGTLHNPPGGYHTNMAHRKKAQAAKCAEVDDIVELESSSACSAPISFPSIKVSLGEGSPGSGLVPVTTFMRP